MPAERPKCNQLKRDGTPCRASARPGSTCCFFHDPAAAEKRAAGRRAGGRSHCRRVADVGDELPTASVAHVTALLGKSINEVRQGLLDPKMANAIGYLASVLLRSLMSGDLEARLAALEARMAQGGGR